MAAVPLEGLSPAHIAIVGLGELGSWGAAEAFGAPAVIAR